MAYTYLAKAISTVASTADPVTINTTINGTCKLLVVSVIIEGNSVFGSDITCDGVAMKLVDTVAATEGSSMMWYIQNNDINTGLSKVISVNNPNSDEMTLVVSQFSVGAGKDSSFDATNSNTGTSTAPSVTGTPQANSVYIDAMFHGYTSDNSMTNNHTALYNGIANISLYGAQYYLSGFDISIVLSWVTRISDDWCTVLGAFTEVTESDLLSHDTVVFSQISEVDGVVLANIESVDGVLTGN
tara:strand:+ start:2790 stop:3518 length:729 start_codon:yes stop_codon:yes gene_type:complete